MATCQDTEGGFSKKRGPDSCQQRTGEGAKLPKHLAIILDGNGRWGQKHGLPRSSGHSKGVESAIEIVTECASLEEVKYLTLYVFSRDNWKRPAEEVGLIFTLVENTCRLESERTLMRLNVRFAVIGEIWALPEGIQEELRKTVEATAGNTGLVLTIALNYSGRADIVKATAEIARQVSSGDLDVESINEQRFARNLETSYMPDPDLVIRTGGEMRISNFLLWQVSYSELWFTEVLWPDFRKEHLHVALKAYSRRQRKFGGVV